MTIVDELKALIKKRGGSTAGCHTISECVHKLTELEEAESED